MKKLKPIKTTEPKVKIRTMNFHIDRHVLAINTYIKSIHPSSFMLVFFLATIIAFAIIQSHAPKININAESFELFSLPENPTDEQVQEANMKLQDLRGSKSQFLEATGTARNLHNVMFILFLLVIESLILEYRYLYIPYGMGRN